MQCNLVLSRGIGTVKGTIFISQDFCCYLVKIFGKKIKVISLLTLKCRLEILTPITDCYTTETHNQSRNKGG